MLRMRETLPTLGKLSSPFCLIQDEDDEDERRAGTKEEEEERRIPTREDDEIEEMITNNEIRFKKHKKNEADKHGFYLNAHFCSKLRKTSILNPVKQL